MSVMAGVRGAVVVSERVMQSRVGECEGGVERGGELCRVGSVMDGLLMMAAVVLGSR